MVTFLNFLGLIFLFLIVNFIYSEYIKPSFHNRASSPFPVPRPTVVPNSSSLEGAPVSLIMDAPYVNFLRHFNEYGTEAIDIATVMVFLKNGRVFYQDIKGTYADLDMSKIRALVEYLNTLPADNKFLGSYKRMGNYIEIKIQEVILEGEILNGGLLLNLYVETFNFEFQTGGFGKEKKVEGMSFKVLA